MTSFDKRLMIVALSLIALFIGMIWEGCRQLEKARVECEATPGHVYVGHEHLCVAVKHLDDDMRL